MNPTKEKKIARELRQSRWWQNLIQNCTCHYCQSPVKSTAVTMDHLIPLSQGGQSVKNNVVPCCKTCNNEKKYISSVEMLLSQLKEA